MACETQCCVLTRGELFVGNSDECELSDIVCMDGGKPLRKIGNVLSCAINNLVEVIGAENEYLKPDDNCPRIAILSSNITLTIGCASKDNLIWALSGEKKAVESGSKRDLFCFDEIKSCLLFPFSKKSAALDTVVVSLLDSEGETVETLVSGVDYKLSKSGVETLRDISVAGAVELLVEYDFDTTGFFEIEFAKAIQKHKALYFKGTNYSEGEGMFDATFYRVLFPPMSSFDLISQGDFFTITLEGIVEKKHGQFYKIIKQEN